MAEASATSVKTSIDMLTNYKEDQMEIVTKYERLADKYETNIGDYLMKLSKSEIKNEDNAYVFKYLRTLSDFERITDRSMNIAFIAKKDKEESISFSDDANRELGVITGAVNEIMSMTLDTFVTEDTHTKNKVTALNTVIRSLCNKAERHHVDRLKSGSCSLQQGTSFGELLTNLEQIAVHCYKIATALLETHDENVNTESPKKSTSYRVAYEEFKEKYTL